MLIRLQKYLADAGICSRRKAEELIKAGFVKVNGREVVELGSKVDTENDLVEFNNQCIFSSPQPVYIMLHKPEGYVTTVTDPFDRPTVMALLNDVEQRVFPVGRLDYDSSGLLLLTNDGQFTYRLTHPKHRIKKIYVAKILGTPTDEEIFQFKNGLEIDGRKTASANIHIQGSEGNLTNVRITLYEGRNRQIRKMCEQIGHPVVSLKRIAIGNLFLGDLKKGKFRYLDSVEINKSF